MQKHTLSLIALAGMLVGGAGYTLADNVSVVDLADVPAAALGLTQCNWINTQASCSDVSFLCVPGSELHLADLGCPFKCDPGPVCNGGEICSLFPTTAAEYTCSNRCRRMLSRCVSAVAWIASPETVEGHPD